MIETITAYKVNNRVFESKDAAIAHDRKGKFATVARNMCYSMGFSTISCMPAIIDALVLHKDELLRILLETGE